MATPKLQTGRALAVIKSDNCNIPFPQIVISGTNTATGLLPLLIDANVDFGELGVQAGDIVYNTTSNVAATVVKLLGTPQNTLELNSNIFSSSGQNYIVYKNTPKDGAVLYVGGAGNLVIQTEAGDDITLYGVLAGSFIPVYTTKVYSATTASNIVALW